MVLRKWDKLPESMKNDAVRPYYEKLKKQTVSLVLKRTFDIVVSFIMLLLLSPVMLVLAIMIKLDTPGPVFFRQERITTYGESFRIFKFRTMTHNAGGPAITRDNDNRITKVGKKIRDLRLDELPQLIDVLRGKMTFVGTRPEAPKFVDVYTDEMKATLLMPAGITCIASILFKDAGRAKEAAENLKLTAQDLYGFGVIEKIVSPEDARGDMTRLKADIAQCFHALRALDEQTLLDRRYQKYRKIGGGCA